LLICCLDNRSLHMAPLLRQGTCSTLFSHGWNPVDHLPSFRRNRESAFTAGEFVSKFIQFHLLIAGLLPWQQEKSFAGWLSVKCRASFSSTKLSKNPRR
jgi:hypothetical protein